MPMHLGRLPVVTLVVGLLAMVGCSDDDGDAAVEEEAGGAPYALLRDDGWTLQEALDPPADDPFASSESPPLAWYAEYVQTAGNSSRMVRLSGHENSVASSREALEQGGFRFADVDVEGWEAAGSESSETSPAVLLLDNDGATIMGLSYEVGLEELAGIAAGVEVVDGATWVEAGGVVR
jgi:hypothetical protein